MLVIEEEKGCSVDDMKQPFPKELHCNEAHRICIAHIIVSQSKFANTFLDFFYLGILIL